MSQKNEAPILILALLVTFGLLGGGGWWVYNQFVSGTSSEIGSSSTTDPSSGTGANVPASQRLSFGSSILVPTVTTPQKQAGVLAMLNGDYATAVQSFEASLATSRNDPETLIYLNNARIAEQPAYTIAIAAPLSSASDAAQELLRGVAQVQNTVNQTGGIQGVPLRIAIVDDANDVAVAEEVAQLMVGNSDILGVIGHFSSDVAIAVGNIYQQNGIVMISPTSTSVQLSQVGDYIFRTVQSDRITADGLARYMLNTMNQQSVAVFYNSQSGYSNSLKDAFTSAALTGGGQVVAEFDLSRGDFNALTDLEAAIQRGATAIMLAANTPTRDQALQVIAANRQRLALLGGDSLYNADVLRIGQDAAVGMVVAAPWHRDSNPNSNFPQEARELWGGDVSWRTALTYDAARAFIAALQQNPTRQGIQQVLLSPGFSATGSSGTIQFLPSGDRNLAPQLVIVEPSDRSGFGYDFVPMP